MVCRGLVLLVSALPCCFAAVHRQVRKHRPARRTFHLRILRRGSACEILDAAWGQVHRLALSDVYVSDPTWTWLAQEAGVSDKQNHSEEQIQDFWGPGEELVRSRARDTCISGLSEEPMQLHVLAENQEVRCISCTGDSSNRIDVVLMGDGYTAAERDRFFEDMERFRSEMFADVTFRSCLPLFNIWAIHVPSKESGIGYHGLPKNTPFQLYKQGNQHRMVLSTSAGQWHARKVCQLADGCEFPVLIGNDEFYGGLGGEFAIGTRSRTTGTMVLRHELGHNFASVGEEYNNGAHYFGVNSDISSGDSATAHIKWKHWLTEPQKPIVEQRQSLALALYPWRDLEASGKHSFSFTSDGGYSSWKLSFAVSGFPEAGSLKVTLDGQIMHWSPSKPRGAERPDGSTVDRQFYKFSDSRGFSRGKHTLAFESVFAPPSGGPIRQLCSLQVMEYGSPSEFNSSPGYIGAFPTWSTGGTKTYRPTDEMCLMRDLESSSFCPICKEGMWLQFLRRMTLLDGVVVTGAASNLKVRLRAVPLAQLRKQIVPGLSEKYKVVWKKGGIAQPHLEDAFSFSGSEAELIGNWEVTLTYETSEVRKDDDNLLTAQSTFTIEKGSKQAQAPPSKPCIDTKSSCSFWASLGYCQPSSQHFAMMQRSCCSICKR